ncbi:arylamine N-acetyltransferase family protein [Staphylococcus pseudoxylosus]|uniref:arylamine N-acetyltransferase family protein n=1 Tax=Staphylococcus pseudoxylosus TaxID=2282419 RepID=UPI00298EFECD|nr:arylamine N-acetyltransferase [Staphylococcus pseudoxylosus]MDW8545764.1 arylamine N-acetyltransferase [Staphylococcus pseudoxylosus]
MTDFSHLENYLEIDTEKYNRIDLLSLNHYIHQYVSHVPFENINVQNKQPIALNDASMLHKILQEHRGGFCYEQNRFFKNYLVGKGFNVDMISATINTGNGWAMAGSHMALKVRINQQDYLVDVGYADVPKEAMPLSNRQAVVTDINGYFRASYIDTQTIEMCKYKENGWQIQYQATDAPKNISDFEEGITYNQHNPSSIFVKKLIVSKATDHGRITLSNSHLTITDYGEKVKKPVTSDNYLAILDNYFGIDNVNILTFERS